MKGLILYGPPASGKDTVSTALEAGAGGFRLFRRIKIGSGKTSTYRTASLDDVSALRARQQIVWENQRYGALYVIDAPGLAQALREGVPIVHVGQEAAVSAVTSAFAAASWLVVELWCDRDTAIERLRARNESDLERRLHAWDETTRAQDVDLRLNTAVMSPEEAARRITRCLNQRANSGSDQSG